jgi:hypothetical protein
VKARPQDLPWANHVGFTENSVPQQVGEGIWGSIRGKSETALRVADPELGTVTWHGMISDHDAWAWYGLRLKVQGRRIAEVEVSAARERNPGPFGDPKKFALDPALSVELPASERSSRRKMLALVGDYQDSVQRNDGRVLTRLQPDCVRRENGVIVSAGDIGSAGIVKAPGSFATGSAETGPVFPGGRGARAASAGRGRGAGVGGDVQFRGLRIREDELHAGRWPQRRDVGPSSDGARTPRGVPDSWRADRVH